MRLTHFKAGGLATPRLPLSAMRVPADWVAPEYNDLRPYCLPADDQGNVPACAGYAMAGWIEAYNWRATNIPRSVDALAIYRRAKELDGMPHTDGTNFEAVIEAAKSLGLIPERTELQYVTSREALRFCMHSYGLVLLGFNTTQGWNQCDRRTGFIGPDPRPLGPHAVLGCYVDSMGPGWTNSWSRKHWGVEGRGRMTWEQFDAQFGYGVALDLG